MPQVGDLITPTIRLTRELGSGGMGSVWVAAHAALQTDVVVKFMHPELTSDQDSLQRFSREAAAGANVKSPHVAQVYDHGLTPDGTPYIVMELLEGCDLAAHCTVAGTLAIVEVDNIVSQTCKALSRAHERGIIHRDIKPQNIFLTNVGGGEIFVKVLDFGIAKAGDIHKAIGQSTKTGAVMGTPYYMSPEQMVGLKTVDHRTDLWAVAIMAFECVTGKKPFMADNLAALAVLICSGVVPVPSEVNPDAPPEFDAWFAKACAPQLADRFASAKELSDALHVVAGLPLPPPRARLVSIADGTAAAGPFSATSPSGVVSVPLERKKPPEPAASDPEHPPPAKLGVTTRAPVSFNEAAAVPVEHAPPPPRAKWPIAVGAAAGLGGVLWLILGALRSTTPNVTLPVQAALVATADPPPPSPPPTATAEPPPVMTASPPATGKPIGVSPSASASSRVEAPETPPIAARRIVAPPAPPPAKPSVKSPGATPAGKPPATTKDRDDRIE